MMTYNSDATMINAQVFFSFLKKYMDEKVSSAPTLLIDVKETEQLIARYNWLTKKYLAAQYPETFSDCEYTKEDVERFRERMHKTLHVATEKILFLNRLCRELTGEKFVVCYINRRTDLDAERQKLANRQKRLLLEAFENIGFLGEQEAKEA